MPLTWYDQNHEGARFNAYLAIDESLNDEQTSEAIYLARKANSGVESVLHENNATYFNIVVNDRRHLASIIRELRMSLNFPKITRLLMPFANHQSAKVS
jgi:hypothetical protein